MKLGKLQRLDLRQHWQHEALNFTKWLALPENLEQLSDELGIGIELIQIEAQVGRYNVDILAQEETSGRKIVIENQLEMTDHSHLGQIITYAAGIEAEHIIWIVREIRDEHKRAIDWLNEHTDEHINFFLIRIELWQIYDSLPAPKFTVICRPNDWAKSVRVGAYDKQLTDTKTMQLEFWQQLRLFAQEQYPQLKLRTPRPQHWYSVSIGRSECHIALIAHSKEKKIECGIYINDDKPLYEEFLSKRAELEDALGLTGKIEWLGLPDKKASRIRVQHPFNFEAESWEVAFKWLAETAIKFKAGFGR